MKKSFILLFLCSYSIIYAQPLRINDVLPDLTFYPLVNGEVPERLSDYNGKAIIIDFWYSSCTVCYKLLPHLNELEEEFGEELKVFVVADDAQDQVVINAFEKRSALKSLGMKIYRRDSAISQMFPHDEVPHIIMIDKSKRVKAIISGADLTRKAVQDLVFGSELNLPLKLVVPQRDPSGPFILNQLVDSGNFLFNSLLTKANLSLPAGMGFRSQGNRYKLYCSNATAKALYASAYETDLRLTARDYQTRILVSENNSSQLSLDSIYCYELNIPATGTRQDRSTAFNYMKTDLDRYFQRSSKIGKRKAKCYVLSATVSNVAEKKGNYFIQEWKDSIEFSQASIQAIAFELKGILKGLPLVIDTDLNCKYTFNLQKHFESFESMQIFLRKNGLLLKEEERELDFLIIE